MYIQNLSVLCRKWGVFVSHKRSVKPRFWLYMMAALVIVFFCVYFSQGDYLLKQNSYITALEAERDQLALNNSELERKIEFSKTDEYIERVARDDLGLVMPGQVRFVAPGQ